MTLLVGSIFQMTRKIVSEMTYNVSMGTLNPTIPYHDPVLKSPKDSARLLLLLLLFTIIIITLAIIN